jgi:hypothetical protein
MSGMRRPDIVVGIDVGQTCSVSIQRIILLLALSLTESRRASHTPSVLIGVIPVHSIAGQAIVEPRKQTRSPRVLVTARPEEV